MTYTAKWCVLKFLTNWFHSHTFLILNNMFFLILKKSPASKAGLFNIGPINFMLYNQSHGQIYKSTVVVPEGPI